MDYRKLFDECDAAGLTAGRELMPNPMTVRGSDGTVFHVPEGLCGFAWVHLPGNTALGRAWKKLGMAKKDYPNGLCVWVWDFNQSFERKQAYARAFVDKLRELSPDDAQGVYPNSRLD